MLVAFAERASYDSLTPDVVLELLTRHYDPMYAQSIGRNFKQFPQALPCELRDRSAESLNAAALSLTAREFMRKALHVVSIQANRFQQRNNALTVCFR